MKLLENLYKISSPSGQERAMQKFIMDYCKKNKLDVTAVTPTAPPTVSTTSALCAGKCTSTQACAKNAHRPTSSPTSSAHSTPTKRASRSTKATLSCER